MELKHVRIFVLAADLKNFSRVAELSFISQSSVTKYIQYLEEELGGRLFVRDGRHTELTELGKVFLPYAKELLNKEQESRQVIDRFHKGLDSRTFRIGISKPLEVATPEQLFLKLMRVLNRLREEYPELCYEMDYYESFDGRRLLEEKQLDIFIDLVSDDLERVKDRYGLPCCCVESNGFSLIFPRWMDDSGGVEQIMKQIEMICIDQDAVPQNTLSVIMNSYNVAVQAQTYRHWSDLYMNVALCSDPVASLVVDNMTGIAEACGVKSMKLKGFPTRNGIFCFWGRENNSEVRQRFTELYTEVCSKTENAPGTSGLFPSASGENDAP